MIRVLYSICFDLGTDCLRKSKVMLTDFIAVSNNIAILLLTLLRFGHNIFTILVVQFMKLLLSVFI